MEMTLSLGYCLHVLRTGRFVIELERVINIDGEVHIGCTLVWRYKRGVRMFCAHTLGCYERGGL